MLWILLLIGVCGAFFTLILTVSEIFSSWRNWKYVKSYAIKMVIFIAISLVGLFGLAGIGALSYEEVTQTGDWELVTLTDGKEISGKASGNLFYVHAYIDTDEVYSFYYKANDNE